MSPNPTTPHFLGEINMGLDKQYGVSLDEFCQRLNVSIDQLIHQAEQKIKLLEENYHKNYVDRKRKISYEELEYGLTLQEKIKEKRQHLERLKEWKLKSNPILLKSCADT